MNTPSKPQDPPQDSSKSGAAPTPTPAKDDGVPDGMDDQDAKGRPHNDRHETETATKG